MIRIAPWTVIVLLLTAAPAVAQQIGLREPRGVLQSAVDRPLRYTPDQGDFVIQSAAGQGQFFNRPLYGSNTAFRVDAGDLPEFMFYLPGRGGNLRLGLRTANTALWLHQAAHLTARYHQGMMVYEIHDPLLGRAGMLRITAVPLHDAEGLIVRIDPPASGPGPFELLIALGGSDGLAGNRRGDIGAEAQPVTDFFQLKPAGCRGNTISAGGPSFTLRGQTRAVAGIVSSPATQSGTADAAQWNDPSALVASLDKATDTPLLLARTPLASAPVYLALQRVTNNTTLLKADQLAAAFDAARASRQAVATRLTIDTPDPFINAVAPALCIAADAVWDEQQGVVMHGAVAWRNRLLGWRGPYAMDELGWHDRMTRHLTYWAGQQVVTGDLPSAPHADPRKNLAADDWTMLHSVGAMSKSHYDMNLAYVDYYLRHALWTGDLEFLRRTWPVIERHFAWEQRCFRRLFGPDYDRLPLYEAYAAIWASDNLQYDGGGVAHASALNYFHNTLAARIASLLGKDPAPYQHEADLLRRAMNRDLWLPEEGLFAEFEDLLPPQTVHDAPALWTYYHTIDSGVPDAFQAWQMSRYVDEHIAHIPIRGPGIPAGDFCLLASTNWMPYIWSINNICLGENAASALADWQANRPDQAFAVFKGNVLDSMFDGLCPGNFHMSSQFDAYRGESQRDFADPIACMSRALVEGLCGVQPDLLGPRVITWRPGFPADWDHASLKHPDFDLAYRRSGAARGGGLVETYTFTSHFPKDAALRLMVPARRDTIARITLNGQPVPRDAQKAPGQTLAQWTTPETAVGDAQLEIDAPPVPAGSSWNIEITWSGQPLPHPGKPLVAILNTPNATPDTFSLPLDSARILAVRDPQNVLGLTTSSPGSWRAAIHPGVTPGAHTFFAQVRAGDFTWWLPVDLDARPAFEIVAAPTQDPRALRFRIRNNTGAALDVEATCLGAALHLRAGAGGGVTDEFSVNPPNPLPGATPITLALADGRHISGLITDWNLPAPAGAPYEPLDLSPLYNASLANIFKTDYLAPRSPYVSLSIPKQGIGGWADNARRPVIDDSGVRNAAMRGNGQIALLGIPFRTPGGGGSNNVAFTSFWDNHPRQISLGLAGSARHLYLLMAGTTNPMRSRLQNGIITVTYTDNSIETLPLINPTNWWPIDQDYLIDDFAFSIGDAPLPPRLDLRSGQLRLLDPQTFKGRGGPVPGGAGMLLDLPLDPAKSLRSLTVQPSTNEVIIGLMAATLVR